MHWSVSSIHRKMVHAARKTFSRYLVCDHAAVHRLVSLTTDDWTMTSLYVVWRHQTMELSAVVLYRSFHVAHATSAASGRDDDRWCGCGSTICCCGVTIARSHASRLNHGGWTTMIGGDYRWKIHLRQCVDRDHDSNRYWNVSYRFAATANGVHETPVAMTSNCWHQAFQF